MKWSEQAWQAALPAYTKILELDFLRELMDGTLPEEKFRFYIQQDALYLNGFGKALAGIAARLENPAHMGAFVRFAGDTMAVERDMHQAFFAVLGKLEDLEPSPTCLLYTSYMLKQLSDAPVETALASVLPCFWVYKEVGDYILAHQSKGPNRYQSWIDTYGGEEYGAAVRQAIGICDELAAVCTPKQRESMTKSYVLCTKMEWMFWDSAYKLEQWPV
ncbi:TENA/THI-4 family protein [uncultured delta proteobacterium]|uniref:Aminopyrimidine aminohydrolase n=1 Tax=uncultured delta proteobacterium TaxID=34034 RepID=A0A212KFM9_9DELT|nr:TENA/THI-4 family protein [uncultured delta proteobacterium]